MQDKEYNQKRVDQKDINVVSKVGENEQANISGKDKDETVDLGASDSSSDESREHEDEEIDQELLDECYLCNSI